MYISLFTDFRVYDDAPLVFTNCVVQTKAYYYRNKCFYYYESAITQGKQAMSSKFSYCPCDFIAQYLVKI